MEKIGSKENPYMYGVYDRIIEGKYPGVESWKGGWVLWPMGDKDKLVYVTQDKNVEQDYADTLLGSLENPFSYTAYREMFAYDTWPGGYVRDTDDLGVAPTFYRSSADAKGCGSGSGSGSGCGCGTGGTSSPLTAGSEYITICGLNLWISWESGTFDAAAMQKPAISAKLEEYSVPNTISCSWVRNYEIKIVINVHGCTSTGYYSIPGAYRC